LPRFPVEACGVDTLHAPFLNERRTRGSLQHSVAGNRGQARFWLEWDTTAFPLSLFHPLANSPWKHQPPFVIPERSRGTCSAPAPSAPLRLANVPQKSSVRMLVTTPKIVAFANVSQLDFPATAGRAFAGRTRGGTTLEIPDKLDSRRVLRTHAKTMPLGVSSAASRSIAPMPAANSS
jgi:hypothetical protein